MPHIALFAVQRPRFPGHRKNHGKPTLIFQTGFSAAMAPASGLSMRTAFARNAASRIAKKMSMYELKVITHFSGAHQLRKFEGACEALHGHNWKIEVYVRSETIDEAGVVIDFRTLKKHLNTVVGTMDHKFLNELEPFKNQNPSSENIARYMAEQLALRLEDPTLTVSRVTAWESETTCATYYPE
jgi:6-pyruvoyltetrahydropterin/6-carboxytetrahydropterin synthase